MCVCKDWYRMISHDSRFRALRCRRCPDHLATGVVIHPETECEQGSYSYIVSFFSGDFHTFDSETDSTPECNSHELVILEAPKACIRFINLPWRGALLFYGNFERFYVCNPTTHEILTLPEGSPSKTTVHGVLAYLPDRNEYRVIRLFQSPDEDSKIQCEILIIRDGGIINPSSPWKVVSNQFCLFSVSPNSGCYAHFHVYWLFSTLKLYFALNKHDHGLIVSFDVIHEKFKVVMEPEHCSHDLKYLTLNEVRGDLLLVDQVESAKAEIWVLKKKQAWEKKFTLNISGGFGPIIPWDFENGEVLVLVPRRSCLGYYDTRSGSFREAKILTQSKIKSESDLRYVGLYWDGFFSLGTSDTIWKHDLVRCDTFEKQIEMGRENLKGAFAAPGQKSGGSVQQPAELPLLTKVVSDVEEEWANGEVEGWENVVLEIPAQQTTIDHDCYLTVEKLIEVRPEKLEVVTDVEEEQANGKVQGWENVGCEISGQQSVIDPDCYRTVKKLTELGLEKLKEALTALGLNSGGTVQQCAERLFQLEPEKLKEALTALGLNSGGTVQQVQSGCFIQRTS